MKTLLLGDLSPRQSTEELFQNGDINTLFNDTKSLFCESEFTIANLECAITEHDEQINKIGPALKTGRGTADVIREIGITCCGLSNNHIFDFGKKGATDTMKVLDETGIGYTGFGADYEDARKNYVFEKDGERICVIAVCEKEYSFALPDRMGARMFDEYDTMDDIRDAAKEYDRVIVTFHGGKEYCHYPSPRLYKMCRAMVRAGADVVLCQHSHCIGCYEKYEDGHILYGQGNFHFVAAPWVQKPEGWDESLAVKYDTKTNEIEFV
ncbi:MAG: CapA family protein, partial [Clostridia bacterium]|nr:CapA family protein [Clostridia bacterium]